MYIYQLESPTADTIRAGQIHNTLLGLEICFRLRRARYITSFQKMYINWNRLPRPLLGPEIFPRLRRAENITRFSEMYINWNRLPWPLLGP